KPFNEIIIETEIIKNTFYKKRNAEIIDKRNEFVKEGGKEKDFIAEPDEIDKNFKDNYEKLKELKHHRAEKVLNEQKNNLELKYSIITKVNELIEKGETLNKTFDEFNKLRKEWENVGLVPQTELKSLQEKYNFILQKFYDWVKINKELKELDLKRNLDFKIKLCEEAEALIIEPRATKAYNNLQNLHKKWKEIGPVANEIKEEIWTRFKEASSIINRKHYNYYQQIKQQQADNLKAKELLCEESEKIANLDFENSTKWQEKSEEMNELKKLWKQIGFTPKKYNNAIFERFLTSRRVFFDKKNVFYKNFTNDLEKNYSEKEILLEKAEKTKNQTNWKETTNYFIDLQERWKNIGPVPRAKKDDIWKKFHTACNTFFENKKSFFKNKKTNEENNLKLKQQLIEDIKNIKTLKTPEENLKIIQDYQKKWIEIGFVPIKQKDRLSKEYQNAVNEKLKELNISPDKHANFNQKSKLENLLKSENSDGKIRYEMEKIKNRIDKIHKEITTLENNISFFVKSKNAQKYLDNFNKKIEKLKKQKEAQEKALLSFIKAQKKQNQKDN
ncbi:MAG: DUF349 domain-containing protein, partial [Bacteroidota bacterium]|nr:DUF349 domain-containing protein [Bacteroidota bacterium]